MTAPAHPQQVHNGNKKMVFDACLLGWKTTNEICSITGLPFQKVNAYLVKLWSENKIEREYSVQRYRVIPQRFPGIDEVK